MSNPVDTKALRALRSAGTGGEWKRMDAAEAKRRFKSDRVILAADDGVPDEPWAVAYMSRGPKFEWQDAELAAAAVNNLIPLCDELDAAIRDRDMYRARLEILEAAVRDCDAGNRSSIAKMPSGCRAKHLLPEEVIKDIHES